MSICLFCKIVQKIIPAKIIFEDKLTIAFEDIDPQAPTHLLVIPKKHLESMESITSQDKNILGHVILIARNLAQNQGHTKGGYRLVINTGPDAGQSVFHIHVHVLAGRKLTWPPG